MVKQDLHSVDSIYLHIFDYLLQLIISHEISLLESQFEGLFDHDLIFYDIKDEQENKKLDPRADEGRSEVEVIQDTASRDVKVEESSSDEASKDTVENIVK